MEKKNSEFVIGKIVEKRIFLIRGHRVMLDEDLADLYRVETKNLNKAVKRNKDRFPEDFAFRLSDHELSALRFQFGTSKSKGRGGRRYAPFVFTEHGIAMLSGVLNSKQAVEVNIIIMRTFVRTKELLSNHGALLKRIEELEGAVSTHKVQIREVFRTLKEMIVVPVTPKRSIGIRVKKTSNPGLINSQRC